MLIISIALTVGSIAILCFNFLAGRLAGLSVMAVWSAATAYFLMTPQYSLRVAHARDAAALAVYGAIGIVLTKPLAKRSARNEPDVPKMMPTPDGLVDLGSVLTDLTYSSELGERLRQRQIEIGVSRLQSFRCSPVDAFRVLSAVFASVLLDSQVRRVVFHGAKRPGVDLLFVTAYRMWPLPLQRSITIGKREEDCSPTRFHGLPKYITANWFENEYGRMYQISVRKTAREHCNGR